MEAVSTERIAIAAKKLQNADVLATACREAHVPYFVACALVEKESGGKNVYGHDAGGALSGFPHDVNLHNFRVFKWLIDQGHTSNGVGPCQITYAPSFDLMLKMALRPWMPLDNMIFGLRLLKTDYDATFSWQNAGARYNGGPHPNGTALAYGKDLALKIEAWKQAFDI